MARIRNAVIFGVMPQVMFFLGVSIEPLPLPWFYATLFLLLMAQVYLWERDNRPEKVFDSDEARLDELPPQLAFGTLVGLSVGAPLVLVARPDFSHVLQELPIQVVFVGFVETFDLIVTVRTVPYGPYVWPVKFALEHWYVRDAIAAGDAWAFLFGFGYTALFAVLFFVLYDARREHGDWFGSVTTWSAHVAANLMLVIFPLAIAGFDFLPVAYAGLSGAPAVDAWCIVGIPLLIFTFLWRRNRWTKKPAR